MYDVLAKNKFTYVIILVLLTFPCVAFASDYSSVLDLEQTTSKKSEVFTNLSDVFQKSRIIADGNIDNVKNIKEITYKLSLDTYDPLQIPAFLSSQRIIQIKDNIYYLKVKHRNYGGQEFRYPPRGKNFQDALKPSLYMDYNDAEISNFVAVEMAEKPKDSYKLSKKLEKYVYQNIKAQSNKSKVKKASQTFADKSGDVTDKAILLATFLRKAEIPAKVMVGAKYSNQPEACFNYYCWVVANLGTEWVTLDPSANLGNVSTVDYVALADADFALNKDVEDLLLAYLNKLSNIKITFLDFSLLDNAMPIDIENKVKMSDMGLLDYIKNSGMSTDEIDYKKNYLDDREFLRLSNIESKKYLQEAYDSYIRGDVDNSIISFDKAFELTPVNDDYLNIDYANKLASLGLFSVAKERLGNIYDHQIWEGKIEILYKMYLPKVPPEYEDEKLFAKILSEASYSPDLVEMKSFKDKVENKKYTNSDYANYVFAKVYFAKNDNKKAYQYINRAIGINPNNYLYKILRVNILASRGNFSAALKELDNLSYENINDRELSYGIKLHKIYLMSKKARNPQVKDYYLAKFYLMSDQDYKAKKLVLGNINARNSNLDYNLLGKIYFNLEDFQKAQEAYNKALSIDKTDFSSFEGLGNLNYIKQEYNEAIRHYTQALKYDKKSDKLVLKIANCHRDMSNDKEALLGYYQALKLNPKNYHALYNIAEINGKYGKSSSLKGIYKQILSINPNFAPAWIGLVKLALMEKNTFLARQYLMGVSHVESLNPIYYYYSGLIEVMDENYAYARRDLNMALQLNPNYTPAKVELEKLK
jgi:tetratricopeptide (TPR) repeat protein